MSRIYQLSIEQDRDRTNRYYRVRIEPKNSITESLEFSDLNLEGLASQIKKINDFVIIKEDTYATIPAPRLVGSRTFIPVSVEELIKFRDLIENS